MKQRERLKAALEKIDKELSELPSGKKLHMEDRWNNYDS